MKTSQPCTKRSCVYETWCITCQERDKEILEDQVDDEEELKEKVKKIRLHKYIGETNRSVFERGWEHLNALAKLDTESHMLNRDVKPSLLGLTQNPECLTMCTSGLAKQDEIQVSSNM